MKWSITTWQFRAGLFLFFASVSQVVLAQMPIPALKPPHGELPPSFWEKHGWQISAAVLAGLLLISLAIWWCRRPRSEVIENPAIIARRALERLRSQPENGILAVQVSQIVRNYIKGALLLSSDELTTTEFNQALRTHSQIPPKLAIAIHDFLRRCDEWKFAPAPPAQLDGVNGALSLVDQIEAAKKTAASVVAAP